MLQAAGAFCSALSRKYIPNPFIFAIVLSVAVYALGIVLTPSGPLEMVEYWGEGFWNLLQFSMQMVVILLFGYVLASSPPARRVVRWSAGLPRTSGQAIMLITVLAVVFGFISWGLGLIVGAIAAKEVCLQAKERGIKVHYPLAAAAGFSGLIIFNSGFSASAPLLVSTEGHFLEEQIGLVPISETILTPYNLIVFVAFLVSIPLVYRSMHPRSSGIEEVPDDGAEKMATVGVPAGGGPSSFSEGGEADSGLHSAGSSGGRLRSNLPRPQDGSQVRIERTGDAEIVDAGVTGPHDADGSIAVRLENAALLSRVTAGAGFVYIGYHFASRGFDLNLNIVNFILLMLGIVAYKTPIAYVRAIDDGIRSCGQIVLQFPFYAGIMGMMASSGLVGIFADWLVAVSNEYTFPLTTLISAAIINLFVPSAGGQWAVQGPLLVDAAQDIGADIGLTIMAFSYGDQLTNGIQPMWMLPLLGLTALKAREILGYTAVMMLFAFVIFAVGVAALPLLFA